MELAHIFPLSINTDVGFCFVIGKKSSQIDLNSKYFGIYHILSMFFSKFVISLQRAIHMFGSFLRLCLWHIWQMHFVYMNFERFNVDKQFKFNVHNEKIRRSFVDIIKT